MYKEYKLRNGKNGFYIFKARPYDDAEYYWAYTNDKENWKIIFSGEIYLKMNGTFEQVVNRLEELNSSIKAG